MAVPLCFKNLEPKLFNGVAMFCMKVLQLPLKGVQQGVYNLYKGRWGVLCPYNDSFDIISSYTKWLIHNLWQPLSKKQIANKQVGTNKCHDSKRI